MSSHAQSPAGGTGFLRAWHRVVGARGVPTLARRRGRRPRVPLTHLLATLTFHVMQDSGTLAEHGAELFDDALVDSSWADRRARLPWAIFAELMQRALRPRATRRHADAFWHGWRVVALDGTTFSVTNTPQIAATTTKARTRRGRAAFAKLTTTVLLEVGLHNPLAAAIGRNGESEWRSRSGSWPSCPAAPCSSAIGCMACRRCGAGPGGVRPVDSHFLLRARADVIARRPRRLPDGTRLVQLGLRARPPTGSSSGSRCARSACAWGAPDTAPMSSGSGPASPIRRPRRRSSSRSSMARRWEHELYFRELKRHVRTTDVLQSHTLVTAAQEIAALVLASAVLAAERVRIAGPDVPVLRISVAKLLERCVQTALVLSRRRPGRAHRGPSHPPRAAGPTRARRRYLTPPRRARTCPRAVRQPMQAWPRLLRAESVNGPLHFQLV
jgi:hypothetical protein